MNCKVKLFDEFDNGDKIVYTEEVMIPSESCKGTSVLKPITAEEAVTLAQDTLGNREYCITFADGKTHKGVFRGSIFDKTFISPVSEMLQLEHGFKELRLEASTHYDTLHASPTEYWVTHKNGMQSDRELLTEDGRAHTYMEVFNILFEKFCNPNKDYPLFHIPAFEEK